MRRRFLLEGRQAPHVYRVDSSDPSRWKERCYNPAEEIVRAFVEGRQPDAAPLARLKIDTQEVNDNRKTFFCDVCKRDFMGSQQMKNHLDGKRHRQVLKATERLKPPVSVVLTHFDAEKRTECIRILKSSLEKPLQQVIDLVNNVPCEIARIKPESKAESLKKCLAKHGISLDIVQITSK